MSDLNKLIISELKEQGADFIHIVDISHLSVEQNRGYPYAILFGIPLTPNYINKVTNTPDYVINRVNDNYNFDDDELYLKEIQTDRISDYMADFLVRKGFNAYSQSDANQIKTTDFDGEYGETFLPHQTIASLAGIGWIGRSNLLVTTKYGSAQCLGSILTDAPLQNTPVRRARSLCGNCNLCKEICETHALKGHIWNKETRREDMILVHQCTSCMNCLMSCPWTQMYMKDKIRK